MKARKHRADSTSVEPFWRLTRLGEIGLRMPILLDPHHGDGRYVGHVRNQREREHRREGNAGGYLDVGLGGARPPAGGRAIDAPTPNGTSAELPSQTGKPHT